MTSGTLRAAYSILFIVGVLAILLRSERTGPYHQDLERLFKTQEVSTTPEIPVKAVVVESTKTRGASNFKGLLAVKLQPDAIVIEPEFPASLIMQKIRIPATAVSGCTETCFGDEVWDADLLIGQTGTEISFAQSTDVFDWCWNNHIPMVSADNKRQWLYSQAQLPDRSTYAEQLASRERYDEQRKRSCQGF